MVGVPLRNEMTTLMFDSVTWTWKFLAKPNISRNGFEYHEKIYLMGGFKNYKAVAYVEVFDCTLNTWIRLPALPFTYKHLAVITLNDEMIVYDNDMIEAFRFRPSLFNKSYSNPVRWDEMKECWEILEESNLPKGFHHSNFHCNLYSVDDTETIRFLTKQNRNPEVQMVKKPF